MVRPKKFMSNTPQKTFWEKDGMDTFFTWLKEPTNYNRINNPRNAPGHRLNDIYKEIAIHMNSIHNLGWTFETARAKVFYTKSRYQVARDVMNAPLPKTGSPATDERSMLKRREKALFICPLYDSLQVVYGDVFPPTSRQAALRLENERPNNSDKDVPSRNSTYDDEDLSSLSSRESSYEPDPKRRRTNKSSEVANNSDAPVELAVAVVEPVRETIDVREVGEPSIRQKFVELEARDLEETRMELRRREQLIEEREKESHQRLLDSEKRHQEMLERRMHELKDEREEIRRDREELRRERDMFYKAKDTFQLTREDLLVSNAKLRTELELKWSVMNR
ncbi:hypothetical protein BGX27_009873 [Mortierella sp. AM989]|nr:hypothetical protein BGX27_009873 [Mortierella sp. AM989]